MKQNVAYSGHQVPAPLLQKAVTDHGEGEFWLVDSKSALPEGVATLLDSSFKDGSCSLYRAHTGCNDDDIL